MEYWSRASTGGSALSGTNEPRMTLLGFFRAMGRHSPPPMPNDTDGEGDTVENDNNDEGDDDVGTPFPSTGQSMHTAARTPRRRHISDLAESPVVHAHDAADRLRDIVLRAEREEGRPVEQSFRMLDPDGNGHIDAEDFRRGLRTLGRGRSSDAQVTREGSSAYGGAFSSIDDEDCEELVALFDANNDGLVSLLDFYRFIGRHSPPPEPAATSGGTSSSGEEGEGDDNMEETSVATA